MFQLNKIFTSHFKEFSVVIIYFNRRPLFNFYSKKESIQKNVIN